MVKTGFGEQMIPIIRFGRQLTLKTVCFLNIGMPIYLWWLTKKLSIDPITVGILNAVLESLCSAVSAYILLTSSLVSKRWIKLFALSLMFLSIGDLFEGVSDYIIRIPPPRGLFPLFHEIPYTLFSVLSAAAFSMRCLQRMNFRERKLTAAVLIVLSLSFFFVSWRMILQPFFSAQVRPIPLYITATTYALGQSILFSSLLISSIRVNKSSEFLLLFSLLTLICTDFALRYQDIGGPIPGVSFFEYGWYLCVSTILSILVYDKFSKTKETFFLDELSKLNSVRVITAALTLFSLFLFLIATWSMESYLSIASAVNISSQFLAITVIWALSNIMSLTISEILVNKSNKLSAAIIRVNSIKELSELTNSTPEFQPIVDSLHTLNIKFLNLEAENLKLQANAARGEIANQVVHDIRSPLAALNLVAQSNTNLSRDTKSILQSSVGRIRDIVKDLSNAGHSLNSRSDTQDPISGVPIFSALYTLIQEKIIEYPEHAIQFLYETKCFSICAVTETIDLQRIVSNLINNSVEASEKYANIQVTLESSDDYVTITIRDTGNGIPDTIIKNLGQLGNTHGKLDGKGIGLWHAVNCLKNWDGSISLVNSEISGAQVTLVLKRVASPQWLPVSISLREELQIVIVDDEKHVHDLWIEKFKPYVDAINMKIASFKTILEFEEWFSFNNGIQTLFLIDNNIGGLGNGISLIEKFGINRESILVTNVTERPELQQTCLRLEISMLPKSLVENIPIYVTGHESPGLKVKLNTEKLSSETVNV